MEVLKASKAKQESLSLSEQGVLNAVWDHCPLQLLTLFAQSEKLQEFQSIAYNMHMLYLGNKNLGQEQSIKIHSQI
jgi:hypothetical protein